MLGTDARQMMQRVEQMERRIQDMQRQMSALPLRVPHGGRGGAGSGFSIPIETTLPVIPKTIGVHLVYLRFAGAVSMLYNGILWVSHTIAGTGTMAGTGKKVPSRIMNEISRLWLPTSTVYVSAAEKLPLWPAFGSISDDFNYPHQVCYGGDLWIRGGLDLDDENDVGWSPA
jgi:hypothetical protein